MPDNLTKEQRSYCMSRIKYKWTKQEKTLHNYLKGNKIKHKMHPKLFGNPDILLIESNTIIFLHGCFWHKCPKCYIEPKTKKDYWIPKINRNVERDIINTKKLKEDGYNILIIWEHEIKKDFVNVISKIKKISN